jgi:predicted nucleotidyltransferase
MSEIQIDLPMTEIAAFCRRWHIIELALFGSVLREDFHPESDVDVLVTYDPVYRQNLKDYLQMCDELEGLLGRRVDLLERGTVELSRNPIRRRAILNTARSIYAA